MKKLSNKQLAGQRLMLGFDGTELNEDLKYLIEELHAGGLILFARNIESRAQVRRLCNDLQSYAAKCGEPPLFIAVDQEGGPVARLKAPDFKEFPEGNPGIKNLEDAEEFAKVTAADLVGCGFNMDMAPVMDIAPENMDSIMISRAFGPEPGIVSKLGCQVIKTLQDKGVMAVAKHFPGIGRTVLDSHELLPIMKADAADIKNFDLIPFQAAIDEGAAGIMLSHILYPELDSRWPASLSPAIAKALLRDEMGFDGLVISDDLDMGAISKHYDFKAAVRQTLLADVDIVLICHKGPNIEIAAEEILAQIEKNEELRERARESAARIMRFKTEYHITA